MSARLFERLVQTYRRCRPVRRVLLLQGENVWWSRWQAGRCLDWHPATLADGVPAFADTGDRHGLQLVIDDGAADIERLASDGFGTAVLGRWQRYRFARQLRRDDPTTRIHWLGRHASSSARAALHHDAPQQQYPERIDALLNERDVVSRITRSESLLASSRRRRLAPCLFVQHHGGVERHLLVVDGVACFARRVALDPIDADAAIGTSLHHALERWGLASVRLILEDDVGSDVQRVAELETLPVVNEVSIRRSTDPHPDSTLRRLSALAAGRAGRDRAPTHWQPLLRRWRARRDHRRLGAIVVLTLLVALAAATLAVTVGREHARQAGLLGLQRESFIAELERLRIETAALHTEPDRAARFLQRFDRLSASAPPTPRLALGLVAGALARHPAIVLDSVAWVRTSEPVQHGSTDDVEFASFLLSDAAAIPARGTGMVLELAGRIDRAAALREAQRQSVSLTEALARQRGVSQCRLIDSPLARAAEGRPARLAQVRPATPVGEPQGDRDAAASGATVGEEPGVVDWRIRCALASDGPGVPG